MLSPREAEVRSPTRGLLKALLEADFFIISGCPPPGKMERLDSAPLSRGPIVQGPTGKSYSRREFMDPVGYAGHETYLWQLDQTALERTEFLVEPQAHHQHLDVGCGTGGFTLRALLPLSRPAWRLMGVDLSPAMLEYARQHNSQGSIAYELLDITSPTEVAAFISKNGQFQRVYCFLCFHFVPDQTVAFLNIGNLLAAYGECLVTACITNPFVDAWQTLHTMPEWKSWVTDPRDVLPSWYYFNYSGTSAQIEDDTRKCVVDAGLECMACEVTECTWLLRDVAYVFEFYSDVFPVSADLPSRDKNALKEAFIEQLRPLVKETPRGCEMVVRIYRVHARPR